MATKSNIKPAAATTAPVLVSVLQFNINNFTARDIGLEVGSSLRARPESRNRAYHRIEFMPSARQFRVDFFRKGSDGEKVTGFIPETNVACWIPAE